MGPKSLLIENHAKISPVHCIICVLTFLYFQKSSPFFSLEEKFHFVSYIIFNDSWKFQDSSSNSKRSVRTHRGWSVSCLTLFVNKISFLKKKKKKKWCAYTSNCLQPKLLDRLLYTLVSQVSCMHNNW